ncbi:unnamed protein product [Lactuca virosa]|uniref:Poly [ADP-ribose] polymerase n=1 Tax=Lactuca virosa TaxID=75947 RepID=A0AAU9PK18_9ASTR|nr:unnamed protein product [Lactuca virosa]
MCSYLLQHVTAEGTTLVKQAKYAASTKKAEKRDVVGLQEQVFVRKVIELHDKYLAYVNDCFVNHTLFHKLKDNESLIELEHLVATHNEKVENLTADNVKFQENVSTLEQEISETQTKFEETTNLSEDRLKEAMEAENRIIDIKIDMQSLQEKIADMEAEEEILLWHGYRLTNYVGILSQGLRIAPPEAPTTVYMFGKGIYFAVLVRKSAQYCFIDKKNLVGQGLMKANSSGVRRGKESSS